MKNSTENCGKHSYCQYCNECGYDERSCSDAKKKEFAQKEYEAYEQDFDNEIEDLNYHYDMTH